MPNRRNPPNVSRGTSKVRHAPCSRCKGPREVAGQAYCRRCRAAIQREYRAANRQLIAELRKLTDVQLRAVLRQVRKGRARGR